MSLSAAISSDLNEAALGFLLRPDGQEDLCFALWHPSQGQDRSSALLWQLVLPEPGERKVHGNASFLPAYFERALGLALRHGAGLAFLHSHLGPGWQGMSPDDVTAERRLAPPTIAATGMPLVGLTAATDGAWSARFWNRVAPRTYERSWCSTMRVVGRSLRLTFNESLVPKMRFREELARTVSAWGPREQQHLMRLRVGIVGAGSVGSIIAESLARMGVSHIKLIDFDTLETINLDRSLHARRRDALLRKAKVAALVPELIKSATASPFDVQAIEYSVAENNGFRAALDCDVLFSCVDRPWPRSVLNFIAYAHLIPVIDGGIFSETKKSGDGLLRADWRSYAVAPSRICMECLGQYRSGDVSADQEGYFDSPGYIATLPDSHFIKHNENVFAFSISVAALEIQQFLSLALALPGGLVRKPQLYHFVNDTTEYDEHACNPNCPFPTWTALGDHAPITVTSEHAIAVRARADRGRFRQSPRYWIAFLIGR